MRLQTKLENPAQKQQQQEQRQYWRIILLSLFLLATQPLTVTVRCDNDVWTVITNLTMMISEQKERKRSRYRVKIYSSDFASNSYIRFILVDTFHNFSYSWTTTIPKRGSHIARNDNNKTATAEPKKRYVSHIYTHNERVAR